MNETNIRNLTTDTHVYFYTNYMSNFHICKIIDPITMLQFTTSEQMFMWYKAAFFKDFVTCEKLEVNMPPAEAKQLGRGVANYNEEMWAGARHLYMFYVNFLKYSQNKNLEEDLLSTGEKILVEASKNDKIWGVGLYANDPLILDQKNWTGQNLLGECLMKVRLALYIQSTSD